MIEKIKSKLEENKGKELEFKFNGSRNQVEKFRGIIENTYGYIFTVKLVNNKNQIRSFSYSDILIDSLEIFIN